jgi:hypothetical protein
MSKPKNMTPEQEAEWKQSQAAYLRGWRESNSEKVRAWKREYVARNPERCRAIVREWRKNNRERTNEFSRKWSKQNAEKVRARHSKRRDALAVHYVARLMGFHSKTLLKYPDLIEAKREQIKIHRQLKQQKT